MHWYTRDGNAAYSATLKEARKEGLLPSVTSVDSVISNPGLDQYKLRQMFKAAQEIDDYDEALKLSRKHGRDAAKLGTVVHHLIDRYISGKPLFFKGQRGDVWRIFEQARDWIDKNVKRVIAAEIILLTNEYAGKADAIVELEDGIYIIDWKTTDPAGKLKKDGTPGKNKMAYPSHCRQLAALNNTFGHSQVAIHYDDIPDKTMNVYISTNVDIPGVWAHKWSKEEDSRGLAMFEAALKIFQYEKGLK